VEQLANELTLTHMIDRTILEKWWQ